MGVFSLRKDSDTLPLYVDDGKTGGKSFRFGRWWRSIPRRKKILVSMVTLICLALLYHYTQPTTTSLLEPNFRPLAPVDADDLVDPPKSKEEEHLVREPQRLKSEAVDDKQRFRGPQNDRQRAVAEAFQHAWSGYKKYAWGHDQLKPASRGYSDWFDTGLTIVDSLDTAIIMGLEKEVKEGTEWIEKDLSFEKDRYVNLFETTIRVLGGLLSSFHLTGNKMFVDRATDLADRLLGAFKHSETVVPLSDVNLKTRHAKSPSWSRESSLSEVTSLQLEFRDLSRITGNKTFEETAFKVSEHIHEIGCKNDGLCDMFIFPSTGKFKDSTTITFGARSDSYYEYLLKQWLQTGNSIEWLRKDYEEAMDSMEKKLLRYSEPNKLAFIGELVGGTTFSPKMDHLVCFLSGTLALGTKNGFPERHLEIARGLGKACQAMYENPTGLGPEIAHYNMLPGSKDDLFIKPLDAHSLLRPEAIEAWFYLYRITGDKMYQEWGWKAFQSIEKYAKLAVGYSSVNSVKRIPVTYRDLMESFFLAETLKYLYLLFADDASELPLDEWVFNTEAHPLPIRTY